MDGMPDELQFLESSKKRESDIVLRLMLVESLLLLTATRKGRDVLRAKKVYPIIRNLHLIEEDDKIKDTCERLVDMLIRDEAFEDPSKRLKMENSIQELSDDEELSKIEELV